MAGVLWPQKDLRHEICYDKGGVGGGGGSKSGYLQDVIYGQPLITKEHQQPPTTIAPYPPSFLYTGYEGPTPLLASNRNRTRDLQTIKLLLYSPNQKLALPNLPPHSNPCIEMCWSWARGRR